LRNSRELGGGVLPSREFILSGCPRSLPADSPPPHDEGQVPGCSRQPPSAKFNVGSWRRLIVGAQPKRHPL